jgi:hypothetical protein
MTMLNSERKHFHLLLHYFTVLVILFAKKQITTKHSTNDTFHKEKLNIHTRHVYGSSNAAAFVAKRYRSIM